MIVREGDVAELISSCNSPTSSSSKALVYTSDMFEAASNIEFLPATCARSFHVIRYRPMVQNKLPVAVAVAVAAPPHDSRVRGINNGSRDMDLACTTSETTIRASLVWIDMSVF